MCIFNTIIWQKKLSLNHINIKVSLKKNSLTLACSVQHLSSAARSNLGLLRALISSLLQTKNCKIRQSPLGSGNLLIIYWFEDSLYVEDQQRTNGWTNICIPWGPVGAKNIITWNYFEWNIYLLPFQTLKTWALRPYIFLGRILASFTLTTAKKHFWKYKKPLNSEHYIDRKSQNETCSW